ncbi:hypothetical protein E3A20_20830, partial [Planctomyces bekefii]
EAHAGVGPLALLVVGGFGGFDFIFSDSVADQKVHDSTEHEFLEDALAVINDEFGTWEAESFDKKGCSSRVAKK